MKLYTLKEWIVQYTDYLNAAVFKKDSRYALRWEVACLRMRVGKSLPSQLDSAPDRGEREQGLGSRPGGAARFLMHGGACLAPSTLWSMDYLPFNARPLLLANHLFLIPPLSPANVGRHALMINTVTVL